MVKGGEIERIIQGAIAIEETEANEAGALGFMARALVQATLPHKFTKSLPRRLTRLVSF